MHWGGVLEIPAKFQERNDEGICHWIVDHIQIALVIDGYDALIRLQGFHVVANYVVGKVVLERHE